MFHVVKGFHSFVMDQGMRTQVYIPSKSIINPEQVVIYVGRIEGVQRCSGFDIPIVKIGQ